MFTSVTNLDVSNQLVDVGLFALCTGVVSDQLKQLRKARLQLLHVAVELAQTTKDLAQF